MRQLCRGLGFLSVRGEIGDRHAALLRILLPSVIIGTLTKFARRIELGRSVPVIKKLAAP